MWQRTFPDDLDLDPDDRLVPTGWVGSRGPINTGWQIAIGLRKYGGYTLDRDLHPFYYDWRRSARDNARLLGELIEHVRGNGKVDLVTHSAGATVAQALQSEHVENIVMVAPAQRGTLAAFRSFMRPERFVRRTFTPDIVATWPFVFELLPDEGHVFVDEQGKPLDRDLWDPKTWPVVDVSRQLASARAFREDVGRASPRPGGLKPAPHVHIIAGDCVPTVVRVLARRDGTYAFSPSDLREHEQHLRDLLFEPGDGTVPVSSAKADGGAMLFCDGHQGIAADPSVHRAIIRALRE